MEIGLHNPNLPKGINNNLDRNASFKTKLAQFESLSSRQILTQGKSFSSFCC
jgi:hypothetical protein